MYYPYKREESKELVFVTDNDLIWVRIITPTKNIQKILDLGARIYGRRPTKVNYPHRSGELKEIYVLVKFSIIKDYLDKDWFNELTYEKEYRKYFLNYHGVGKVFKNTILGLHRFGAVTEEQQSDYVPYTNKYGKTIQIRKHEANDFGRKRYVKNGKKWFSNKKY